MLLNQAKFINEAERKYSKVKNNSNQTKKVKCIPNTSYEAIGI